MKVAELLSKRQSGWHELELTCRELEGGRKLTPPAVLKFAGAYRSACADLALADSYQLPPHTVQYLHELVGRAHNQLYRSKLFHWRNWGHEIFVQVPGRLLTDWTLWLAAGLFWGVFFFAMALGYNSSKFAESIAGEEAIQSMEEMYARPIGGRDVDEGAVYTGLYVIHNAGIGLRCFAGGLMLGVGGLLVTLSNALQLGAIFGHMFASEYRGNFVTFVTAHGPFELTAIVFSAAAGLRMGFSVIATGGLSRGASLRLAVRQAMPTAAVAVILFCLAAMIEGLLSPSSAPYAVKAAVAVMSSVTLFFYVVVLGLAGRRQVATG